MFSILKLLQSRLPQQAAIPKVIYKKSSKRALQKGPELCEDCDWRGWAADSWGRDRERKKKISERQNMKAENVMKEEVVLFVIFNKYIMAACAAESLK